MAVRTTMATLITRTRALIGDPAGGSEQFAGSRRTRRARRIVSMSVRRLLRSEVTLNPGGSWVYTDYYANVTTGKTTLYCRMAHGTRLPRSRDNLTGHWTFANVAPGQIPPLFITGKYYDIYGSAARP